MTLPTLALLLLLAFLLGRLSLSLQRAARDIRRRARTKQAYAQPVKRRRRRNV